MYTRLTWLHEAAAKPGWSGIAHEIARNRRGDLTWVMTVAAGFGLDSSREAAILDAPLWKGMDCPVIDSTECGDLPRRHRGLERLT